MFKESEERQISKEREPLTKTTWLFPGQGAQFVGMGRELFEKDPAVRAIWEKADEILGFSISEISFNGPAEELNRTVNTQLATFVDSYANMFFAKKKSDENNDFSQPPVFVAGLSFGQYNALVAADSLTFEDGLRLVWKRADLTQKEAENNPAGMMAVRVAEDSGVLKDALRQFSLDLCVVNNDELVVIGGPKTKLGEAEEWFRKQKIKTKTLNISGAFHSRLMIPVVERFTQALEKVDIKPAKIPIIANTTARPITTKEEIKEELIDHLTRTVRWRETINYLKEQGIEKTLEFGESGVVTKINKKLLGGVAAAVTIAGIAAVIFWRHRYSQSSK